VTISAVATLVDAKASEKPERTSLTLKASDSVQTMDIYNYPSSQTFVWKPATGGDTTLTISLPSLDLFLSYSGPNAFPSFLEELIRGDLVLVPGDFPDHAQQLAGLGITEIRVIMKADGALPVIGYHNLEPPPLPSSIIKAE
jgi:type VI secretion system protein ImpL